MPTFLFALSHTLNIPGTDKPGTITGRTEYLTAENQYLVEWAEVTGAAARWFTESELTGSVTPAMEPDARFEPLLTTIPPTGAEMTDATVTDATVTEEAPASKEAPAQDSTPPEVAADQAA